MLFYIPYITLRNTDKIFFHSSGYIPEIIYTNSFNKEIEKQRSIHDNILFNYFIRYDDNVSVYDKLMTKIINPLDRVSQVEFPQLENNKIKDMDKIFDVKFDLNKENSNGLGLYIVSNILYNYNIEYKALQDEEFFIFKIKM